MSKPASDSASKSNPAPKSGSATKSNSGSKSESASTSSTSKYYFSASMRGSEKTVYSKYDRMEFGEVHTDENGLYNPLLYQYTCPITGKYFFTVNSLDDRDSLNIMINDVRQDASMTFHQNVGPDGDEYHMYSVFSVCQKGDKVWVQTNKNMVIQRKGFYMFSGMISE